MRLQSFSFVLCVFGMWGNCLCAQENLSWDSTRIHQTFHAEGASVGDINGDGNLDIVEGPLWHEGPSFQTRHEIAEPKTFPVSGYSNHFSSGTADVNADGAVDLIAIGFPGAPARLYLNPGHDHLDQHWRMVEITGPVDNESPAIVDLIPGGTPEIVCGNDSQYGYYSCGKNPEAKWTWTPIGRKGSCPHRFTHGMGVGDVNGDGRLDLLDKTHWWEQPESGDPTDDGLWRQHTWSPSNYGGGGAQICVDDFDGDGDSDIVTSLNAHGYGLAWFEQTSPGQFTQHPIMGASPEEHAHGVAFSQMHAVAIRDMDGDGFKDLVTGKRYFAHGGKDPGGHDPKVLYWFRRVAKGDSIEFAPEQIHGDSGVGVDVVVADLNGDEKPDVVSCSKDGLTVHLQTPVKSLNR